MLAPDRLSFIRPKRVAEQKGHVWAAYTELAKQYEPVNLGIGYADYVANREPSTTLAEVVANADNAMMQYAQQFVSESKTFDWTSMDL